MTDDLSDSQESGTQDTEPVASSTEQRGMKDHLEGEVLSERYKLVKRIDAGGFGAVYKGVDLRLDSTVAVKILFSHAQTGEDIEAAFRKEARLTRKFRHPNVVEVYDYGIDEGVGYIVMEFLRGPRLDQLFKQNNGCLPPLLMRMLVTEMTLALENAHEQQLVHRDLKPQNIILVDEGEPEQRFILLDLGIASQMDAENTLRNATSDTSLSPNYASPEQFGGEEIGPQSDIYSLATIIYQMLTGTVPFRGQTLMKLMLAIRSDPPPPFAEVAAERDIPEKIQTLIMQCLEKEPEKRPATITEVRARFLEAMPAEQVATAAHGSSPTIAIDDVFNESMPTYQPGPDTVRNISMQLRQNQRGVWAKRIVALLVVVVIGLAAFFLRPKTQLPVEPVSPALSLPFVDQDEWKITAGESKEYRLRLMRTNFDGEVSFEATGLPEGVSATISLQSDIVVCELSAGIQQPASSGEFQIAATPVAGESAPPPVTADIPFSIAAAKVWQPEFPESFPVTFHPDMDIVTLPNGDNYYRGFELRFTKTDAGPIVKFLLMQDLTETSDANRPFYITRDKVRNEFFAAYLTQTKRFNEWVARDAEWNTAFAEDGLLPMTNLTVEEAHACAAWLDGGLPTMEQWDIAAGVYLNKANLLAGTQWREGPYRGVWDPRKPLEIHVNKESAKPLPLSLDTAADDVAPWMLFGDAKPQPGCLQMAGNVREFTTDLEGGKKVPLGTTIADSELLFVYTRGSSHALSSPPRYDDWMNDPQLYNEPNRKIGFRIVLLPR